MDNNDHIGWATVCHIWKLDPTAHYHPSEIEYWYNKTRLWQEELLSAP